ncbi:MAG: molybdopterin molybdotransferase MoeA [SAR324 cluster bacterium]|nr:molybdopterin molybdotransferase MoeA [SAR324 cluster bacterium]
MLDPDKAKKIILEHTSVQAPQDIDLEASLGLVVHEDIQATCAVPAFDNSAMDGYAVRQEDLENASTDTPVVLQKLDYIPAGSRQEQPLQYGQCFQIATGAEIPPGANAVVMKENVTVEGAKVWFSKPPKMQEHIRFKGEDIEEGAVIISRGETIGPGQISLLAAFGYAKVFVKSPPRITIITTGSELVDVGENLEPGKIRDSNSYMLAALLREENCFCDRIGIVKDDPELLLETLKACMDTDFVLISGGVSVGEHDFVKSTLKQLGVEEIFWKVRIKPGKPFFFGKNEKTLVFGMPGNPASSYVVFEEFVRPSIRKAMGQANLEKNLVTATLEKSITQRANRRHYLRAKLRKEENQYFVKPLPFQGSHSLRSLADANALIIVPENSEELPEGSLVSTRFLTPL